MGLLLSGWMIQVLMKLHSVWLLGFPVVVSNSKIHCETVSWTMVIESSIEGLTN